MITDTKERNKRIKELTTFLRFYFFMEQFNFIVYEPSIELRKLTNNTIINLINHQKETLKNQEMGIKYVFG